MTAQQAGGRGDGSASPACRDEGGIQPGSGVAVAWRRGANSPAGRPFVKTNLIAEVLRSFAPEQWGQGQLIQ
jgi:hypothetical protein